MHFIPTLFQSTSVAVTIYEHFHWYSFNVKSQKLLLMPLMRAQKPCHLTGVFFEADLSLFLWVILTSLLIREGKFVLTFRFLGIQNCWILCYYADDDAG